MAIAVTRQYVSDSGTAYRKHYVKEALETIDRLVNDQAKFEEFCRNIASYRYVDDTLSVLTKQR